jgi:hypothetical protein
MAESTLVLAWSDLKAEVGYLLGYSRTSTNWSAAQTTEIEKVIQSGLRRFYYPGGSGVDGYEWTFLKPTTSIEIWSDIAIGTTTVTGVESGGSSTITATASSFYPTMIGNSLVITDIGTYTITGYTSATVVTVSGDATCAGKTFSIATTSCYQLPDDFGAMYGQMTFETDDGYTPIELVGEGEIRALHQTDSTGQPLKATVRPKASTGAAGQRFELYVWPEPSSNYTMHFRYHAIPNALSDSYPYPLGGAQHSETILAVCLWVASERINDDVESRREYALERLNASISRDKRQGPRNYGYNADLVGGCYSRFTECTVTHEDDV